MDLQIFTKKTLDHSQDIHDKETEDFTVNPSKLYTLHTKADDYVRNKD